jgi:branched-chain amino acid transport system ATP-binding protein
VHPLLEVTQLNVFYGDAQAIWEVSFHVEKEKMVALVGANGAGKTTLLNTISAVLRPSKGRILFSGEPLAHHKPEDVVTMGISHVPEGRRLFSRLTVLENLELGAFPARTRPFFQESLDRAFRLFPVLKQRIDQPAGSLSGGEQQMLAIARGLMARPKFLLLDEPSMGLAPFLVNEIFKIIKELHRENISILLVEQNVKKALKITQRAYVMELGRIPYQGTSEELLKSDVVRKSYLGES